MSTEIRNASRRRFLTVAGVSAAAALLSPDKLVADELHKEATSQEGMHPTPAPLLLNPADTAVVFIDPQNDVPSEHGKAWPAVGQSVKKKNH